MENSCQLLLLFCTTQYNYLATNAVNKYGGYARPVTAIRTYNIKVRPDQRACMEVKKHATDLFLNTISPATANYLCGQTAGLC